MRRAWVVLGVCGVLVGCTHSVKMELQPDYARLLAKPEALTAVRPARTFVPGTFVDKRADTTRMTTFKQGVHTYNLYAQRPLSDVVFDGMREMVTQAGHQWTGGSVHPVRVDAQLLNLQAARNAGLVNVGATSSIQLRFDFVDVESGRLLHSEVYNGTDERTRALIGVMSMVKASVDQSIVNCIAAVGNDTRLAEALRIPVTSP
jgi:hypothetical protein